MKCEKQQKKDRTEAALELWRALAQRTDSIPSEIESTVFVTI